MDQIVTLKLDGMMDIQRAVELKEMLQNALAGAEHLQLNLEEAMGADISGLQLLCSAHRQAFKFNKRLTVIGKASPPFREAVRDGGYERERGCPFDADQTCLWRRDQ